MSDSAKYADLNLSQLLKALRAQDALYLNAIKIHADAEIIKEIGKNMDCILHEIKQRLHARSVNLHEKFNTL